VFVFYKFLIKVTLFLMWEVLSYRESLNSELSIAEQMVSLATVYHYVSSAVWCTVSCWQRTKYCGVIGTFDCCAAVHLWVGSYMLHVFHLKVYILYNS